MPSIIQDWVTSLHLRQQGVLVSAVRGCDVAPKHDSCKPLSRALRAEILVPASPEPSSYMQFVDDAELVRRMDAFLGNFDHYPIHFVMHLLHAASIVGYYSPSRPEPWRKFYHAACKKLHVHPESKEDVERRLCAPEDVFQAQQDVRVQDSTDSRAGHAYEPT